MQLRNPEAADMGAYRWSIAFVATALLALASSALAADELAITAGLSYGGVYAPDTWVPLWVDVRNGTSRDISGTVRVRPLEATIPEFVAPAHVPSHSRLRTMLWVYLPAKTKSGEAAGTITFHDANGAQIGRSEFAAATATPMSAWFATGQANSGMILSIAGQGASQDDDDSLQGIADAMQSIGDRRGVPAMVGLADAPRSVAFYHGVYCVGLLGVKPELLDGAQRQALLDYVASGGIVLLSAPDPELLRGSWLQEYLPVSLVGMRQFNAIQDKQDASPRKLSRYDLCTEALPGNGVIVLRDDQYVHAAYRTFGLGRFVFTSFPASSLNAKEDRTSDLWRLLLNFDRSPVGIAGSQMQRNYAAQLEPLLGRHAASWTAAAAVVAIFMLLVLVSHLVWRGARRPRAFAVSLGAAGIFAVTFGVMAAVRQKTDPLQQASFTLSDVWAEGCVTEELAAVAGPPQSVRRVATEECATVRPILFRSGRPAITQCPTRMDEIPVQPDQVSLVTLARRLQRGKGIKAIGRFTDRGLAVDVENGIGQSLSDGQIIWNHGRLAIPALPQGSSSFVISVDNVRPAGDFTTATGVPTQDQKLKGEILKAVATPADTNNNMRTMPPVLVAWAASTPVAASVIEGVDLDRDASENLVRLPLEIAASKPGERVRVDGVFNALQSGESRALPYDFAHGEFIQTATEGSWPVCIQLPRGAGTIRPTHAHVHLELDTPQHKLTVRRQQVPNPEKPRGNPSGAVAAEWDGGVGIKSVEFDVSPDDYDARGRLWLMLEVQSAGASGGLGVPPQWRIARFDVDVEGEVVAGDKAR